MFRIFVRCFTVAAICVTGISAGAFATQINSLSVNSGFCTLSAFDSFSTTSGVETNFNASDGQCAFSTIARAGGGSVGIDLGLVTTPGLGGLNATVTVETEALIEITIGVPENFGGGEIPVSFTPHLSGDVAATIVSGDGFLHAASASVTAFASIAGSRIDGSNNVASRNVEA